MKKTQIIQENYSWPPSKNEENSESIDTFKETQIIHIDQWVNKIKKKKTQIIQLYWNLKWTM
jgi:hypothetical protein